MNTTLKRVLLLIILSMFALAGGLSLVWYTTIYPSTTMNNPFESPAYAGSVNAKNFDNVQERLNGKNTTTLQFTVQEENFAPEEFFSKVSNDLRNLDSTELINIELNVTSADKTIYSFNYYPTSPASYSENRFTNAVDLFVTAISDQYTTFAVTIKENNQENNIKITGTTQWLEWDAVETKWGETLELSQDFYPVNTLEQRNIYHITYENNKTSNAVKEVGSRITTTFTTELGLERSEQIDFTRLSDVAQQKYDYLHFEDIFWTLNPETLPNEEQIVFVIEDKGDTLNDALAKFQQETSSTRPLVPGQAEYVFRYSPSGANLAVFPTSYLKQ